LILIYSSFKLGVYHDVEQKIKYFFKIYKNKLILKNNTINIRLAGDGTNIGNNLMILNFNFGFLDKIAEDIPMTKKEKKQSQMTNPNNVNGNFIIGLFHMQKESYDEVKESLAQVVSQLSKLTEITIDDKSYNINYYLGGDLKFLACVLGLKCALSNNPCPLCHIHKKDFKQFQNPDILADKSRTIGDFSDPGQDKEPIINFIPINRVVVDPLHLELRVTDRLEYNLLNDLQQADLSWKKQDSKNQLILESYLVSIGIKKPFKTKDNGNFEFRSLTGREKRIIYSKIDLKSLFPNLKNVQKKAELWKMLPDMMGSFKSNNTDLIKENTLKFFSLFREVYNNDNVIPYIHILSHIEKIQIDLQEFDLPLNNFSMQGMEKLNDMLTIYYNRCSNKRGEYLCQILKKRTRVEIIQHTNTVELEECLKKVFDDSTIEDRVDVDTES
jgi:hypothetical protein